MVIAQASFASGQPRQRSAKIRIAPAPPAREGLGNLYLVLEGGNERLCANFIDVAVRSYFSSETNNAISGLMRSMRVGSSAAANAAGPEEEHLDIGATGLVVRESELYIAQLLPSQVYIFRENELNSLPDASVNSDSGRAVLPFDKEIELFRATLEEGDTIAITSSSLARTLREREIRGMLVRYSPEECVQQMTALAAQRGVTECDVLVLRASGRRPTMLESPPRVEQRPAVAVPPPVRPLVSAQREAGRGAAGLEATVTARERPSKTPLAVAADLALGLALLLIMLPSLLIRVLGRLLLPGGSKGSDADSRRGRNRSEDQPKSEYTRRREAIAGDAMDLAELNKEVLQANKSTVLKSWPEASEESKGFLRGIWSAAFSGNDPLARRRRSGRRLGPGSAILLFSIAVLMVMVAVLAIRREEAPTTTAASPTLAAQATEAVAADSEPPPDPDSAKDFAAAKAHFDAALKEKERGPALAALQDANDAADRAGRAGYNPAEVNRLLAQIQAEQDRLNQVYRLVTSATIGEFEATGVGLAGVRQLDVREDIQYVVDAVQGQLREYRVAKRGSTVLKTGEQVGQVAVGEIVAVVARDLSLLVVDKAYNVFSIVPDRPVQLLRIRGTDQWKLPVAMDNFANNFYVLDPAANRIHKYQPTANGYEVDPANYFDTSEDVDVSTARDMAIDGDVFILFSDNTIMRFRGGKQIGFQVRGLDRPILKARRIFTDLDTDSLYVVDEGNTRIVELDKREGNEGQFLRQFLYRGADDFFADIRGIWVSELDGRLLILGKESLRQFVLPKLIEGQ